ncbi:MAG: hypothetical protein RLZ98_913, partial [Pseudomonadota bacterium]
AGLVSLVAFTAFVLLHFDTAGEWKVIQLAGWPRIQMLVTGMIGWLAAVLAAMTVTRSENRSGQLFAFLILALMIFFVHETYQYTGKVRIFPLFVGYTGIVLCVLDILTLTDTSVGQAVTRIFGSELVASEKFERSVPRELVVIVGMGAAVALIYALGFLAGGTLFIMAWVLIGARRSLRDTLIIGLGSLAFTYLLFEVLLKYELHRGPVTIWLLETILK